MAVLHRIGSIATRKIVRHWSEAIAVSSEGWSDLAAELSRWRPGEARFWWRDDDTIDHTPALARLLGLSEQFNIPLALAVIPALTSASLPRILKDHRSVCVLAHGWSHHNHARSGTPLAELAHGRLALDVFRELSDGRSRLEDLFGPLFQPVQVPPHNVVAPDLVSTVARAGFKFISVDRDFTGLPMPTRNIHIDIIDWSRGRALDPQHVVRNAVAALRLRRYGLVPSSSPIGLLTHHLVHDCEMWSVTKRLLQQLASDPAVSFPQSNEIFRV